MPTSASNSANVSAAVCPHCSLLCDDLSIKVHADLSIKVRKNGCNRADSAFAIAPLDNQAYVDGEPVSSERAINVAAQRLARAKRPLFGGLATDVDGIRRLIDLAERHRAIVDHVHGDALNAMSRILQTRGWYATTLSEVRNRADVVLVVDVDFTASFANFSRRCLDAKAHLRPGKTSRPRVSYLGRPKAMSNDLNADQLLKCSAAQVHETLLCLLALLRGQQPQSKRAGNITMAALANLAAELQAAQYATVVFSPSSLGPRASAVVATILDLIDQLNITGRAAALSLGGNDGGQTAVATSSWLTGYPLRTRFGKTLEYAPDRFGQAALLAERSIDCMLWVDAFGRHPAPTQSAPKNLIVLSSAAPSKAVVNGVFIPVGTPGVDHHARLVRTDSVVTLALEQLRATPLPSVAEVATQLLGA